MKFRASFGEVALPTNQWKKWCSAAERCLAIEAECSCVYRSIQLASLAAAAPPPSGMSTGKAVGPHGILPAQAEVR